ncbi:hypothetical protein EW146_g4156 [Bondarzewia mesenterica]|uniref:Myotubularin phosphatase domain-containing protein n=1 Tax=Bondarzewia mesenterica TaxID=1095465 RepID=A0A4S4LVC5_9AGAM|nr:hypothetical protein EW146_g4156 [Bondarzewia mesenterica]
MDSLRITKVENILCTKPSKAYSGTLHLTAHHLIFSSNDGVESEMWIPYPLIALVTRLPQTLSGQSPIAFRCRTFESFSLSFDKDNEAVDVFESVKELTVAPSVNQLYAFFYTPNPPLNVNNGWSIYSVREEFGRMGVGTRSKAWRFTDVNKDYSFSPTYPARLVVPTRISDTTLQYAAKYRSKGRIPALTYLHWGNYGSITRSSQPMVGLTNARSIQDEKLVEASFQSHFSPDSRAVTAPVYGATTTNLIVDARPTTNAMANTAKGAGTENMDHYKDCKKIYLGIDHIHAMRESLARVAEALRETEALSASVSVDVPGAAPVIPVDRQALRRSGWLRHISAILEGSQIIVRNVHVNSSHVLIHCSDGWDRTSQLSSISQLCLDPFYRTIQGFQILIEKDWVSFGHKFLDRCGHLSSEKFFVAPLDNAGGGGGAEAAQAFFASVQNRFTSNHHIKETSPVFHQFLEAVRNIQRQFPDRFEFNELFLHQLYYHLYSCQFGTFLFNSERDRRTGAPPPCERTVSIWDFLNSSPQSSEYVNPSYKPELDDPTNRAPKADQGVLFPNAKDVRFWHELYGRGDEEMNGRFVTAQQQGVELVAPLETAEQDPGLISDGILTPSLRPLPPSPTVSPAPELLASSSSLNLLGFDASRREPSPLPLSQPQRQATPLLRPPLSPAQSRQQLKPPEPLSASVGGVRSIWGKLSSNASAALSVVQDAYGGMSKDFRGLSVGGPDISSDDVAEKGGELRGREELLTWTPNAGGEEGPVAVRPSTFAAVSSNPWASVKTKPSMPSMLLDNPWNTVRSPDPSPFASSSRAQPHSTTSHPPLGEVFGSWGSGERLPASAELSGLPLDYTIAQPTPRRASTLSSASVLGSQDARRTPIPSPVPEPSKPDNTSQYTDPLGVGLM